MQSLKLTLLSGAMLLIPLSVAGAQPVKLDTQALCEHVSKKQILVVRYNRDPEDAQARELLPYAVGYTRDKNVLLFGLQISGFSKSAQDGESKLPSWRNFRLDRIKSIEQGKGPFKGFNPAEKEMRAISEFVCKNEFVTRDSR